MRKKLKGISLIISAFSLGITISLYNISIANDKKNLSTIEQGKKIAFDRKKGNCLACHIMGDGKLPGNIGPPLIGMKARFPDKLKLREKIYDPRLTNSQTIMIPYGAHKVLSDEEIDKVVEFVHSL